MISLVSLKLHKLFNTACTAPCNTPRCKQADESAATVDADMNTSSCYH
jgi:hypothetical protein